VTRLLPRELQRFFVKLVSRTSFARLLAVRFVLALVFSGCILAAFAASMQDQTQASAQKEAGKLAVLEPGKPVERELRGGETHSYGIEAQAGQFLHAIVDQLGIDVALTLYGPDGKLIASMDSPNGEHGLEQISTIAESNGTFRLNIASGDKNTLPGRYRVLINPLRAPKDADRARISAERMFFEGIQLQVQGTGDSLLKAVHKYVDTIPLWRTAGENYEQALALTNVADLYEKAGEHQKALDCYGEAVPLWRAVGDSYEEALALRAEGLISIRLGENQKALDYFNQSLPIWRARGDRSGEATILNNFGTVYDILGNGQKALEYYSQALPLEREAGDRYDEAATLNNIGHVYTGSGKNQEALDYFHQAATILHSTGDRSGEASALNNIGRVYDDLGQKQKALEYFWQALPLQRAEGDRFDEAISLNNIGLVYYGLGENQKALGYYKDALTLRRAVGDRLGEAVTLNNIGRIHEVLGEKQKALDYYNQALLMHRTVGNRNAEAITLCNIANLYDQLGERGKALENYGRALALSRAVGDPLLQSQVLSNLMGSWRKQKQPETAIFFGKQAVNQIQQIRTNIRRLEKETQQGFLNSKEKTYRDLADLLITQGRLPEAQQVIDLLKNEEYFEFIRGDGDVASSLTAAVSFTKEEEALNGEFERNAAPVTAIGNEYTALHAKSGRTEEEEKHLAELAEQLNGANERFENFLNGLYEERGKTREAQTSVEALQEHASGMQRVVGKLGHGTVALYTLVGEEKYRVIVVTPSVMVAREYPIRADDLRKKVFELREMLMDPKSNPAPKAQELYRILVGPAEKDLEGAKAETLMWSLDDVLRYLPMAALHDGHGYLVEKYRNTVFTPASVDSLTEHTNISAWQGLGMGVSKSYGGFSALPAVPEELHRIIQEKSGGASAGVLPGQVMLDESFTAENMKKALEKKFSLVHIASHFDFAAGNETDSFLLLGGKGERGEHLTLAEIRNDPRFDFTGTELLTLSACNTAVSGAASNGREIDGLGYVAQRNGARAVVASLWGVYDLSTGVLMEEFYKEWTTHAGMPKAEALREAQLALLRGGAGGIEKHSASGNYAHPYYWAPFILIGNWQ
jgi:CHAT domain-containing protein/Tfp pilus assembly protein PilF